MPKSTKKIDIKESKNELPKESNKKEESIEDKKKGKNKKDEPVIEDKNNKKEVIQPVKEKKVIDISKVETEYNETFKEWESVNQSLSNLKKEITTLEEKRHNILTQLNKLLKKIQGDENENIINPLETPSILKKEITKVIIQPKVDSDDSSDEDENSESFKKGIQNFNKESDSDTDSD